MEALARLPVGERGIPPGMGTDARESLAALSQGLNALQGAKWKVWQHDKAGRAGSGAEAPKRVHTAPLPAGMQGGILPSRRLVAGRGCARALCHGLALKPGQPPWLGNCAAISWKRCLKSPLLPGWGETQLHRLLCCV